MEESKNTNFAELLLEDSCSEAENSNISSENDESKDMGNANSDDDQVENIAFRADIDMTNPTFSLGMTFINATEFRVALRAYSVKNNREISLKKNESGKISAKCSDGCPWRIYASRKAPDDPTIMIKTLVEKHSENCLFVYVNKNVKSRMIAQKYLHYLRKHPDISIGDFMEKIHEEMNVEISVSQAYRAKRIAKEMIEGRYKEQYAKLEDYCAELKKKNPGSTILLKTTPKEEDGKLIFERIYICLEPCKRGWKAGCRPLIGMGAFLKVHMVVNF